MSVKPRVAVFPGSFDPPTLGHLDVIQRAAALFDTLIVALLENAAKQPMLTTAERVSLLKQSVAGLENVEVDVFGGLLAEYARQRDATVVVRGIRGGVDLDYERQMADTNRHLNPAMDTLFLTPSPAVSHVSSTLVREIVKHGGSVRGLVPAPVEAALAARQQHAR